MHSTIRFLAFILCISAFQSRVLAQGCSDAGFCTIGGLAIQNGVDEPTNKITFSTSVGKGDRSVLVVTPAVQYDRRLSKAWSLQGKLTTNYADGELGRTIDLGDLFVSGIRTVSNTESMKTLLTIGIKAPVSVNAMEEKRRRLPMVYQSSLGTIDAIAGISLITGPWQLSAGWQHPLSKSNKNEYINEEVDMVYPSSRLLKRKPDALFRVVADVVKKERLKINTGLLAIYHIAEDEYHRGDRYLRIDGSKGLTLNVTAAGFWQATSKLSIGLTAGTPIVARDNRPDGLTRYFVIAPELAWHF